MADTAAALVIQLTAETRDFQREMRKATGVFDTEGRKIERRQAQLKKNLEKQFSGFGRNLFGFASAGAALAFSKSILSTADALSDASQQLGVTVQQLQSLDYAARVSGGSSEKLTQALSFLADGLGEAQRGEGQLADAMRLNNIQMGTTVEVLFDVADRVKAARTETEKMNIATTYLGAKAGKGLVSFLNEGADGLRKLQREAAAKGQIWDPETIARLDSTKDSFETLQKALVNIGAIPASKFMQDLSQLLEALAKGDWKAGLEKLGNLMPAIAGAAVGGRIAGLPGAVIGGAAGAIGAGSGTLQGRIDALEAKLKNPNLGGADRKWSEYMLAQLKALPKPAAAPAAAAAGAAPAARTAVPKSKADIDKAARDAESALRDASRIREVISSAAEDARRASDDSLSALNDTVRAQDQALLTRMQGSVHFAEIQKEVIEETARFDKASLDDRVAAELHALNLRKDQDLEHLRELKATKDQELSVIQSYSDQRNSIESNAAEARKTIEINAGNEILQIRTREIELNDEIRSGLGDVFTAGLHGFDSMKDAAVRFLETLAEMIIQLYVIKPLIESVLGPSGSSLGGGGGGGFGSILTSIFGFAGGGVMTPNGPRQLQRFANGGRSNKAAIFGEAGPEAAVPLPDGRRIPVELRMPEVGRAQAGGGVTILQSFDLSGAVVTDELFARMERTADSRAQAQIAKYDRSVIPGRVRVLTNDPRRNY
jgi:hypothetical protein